MIKIYKYILFLFVGLGVTFGAEEAKAVDAEEGYVDSIKALLLDLNTNRGHCTSPYLDTLVATVIISTALQIWMVYDPLPFVRMNAVDYKPESMPLMLLGGISLEQFFTILQQQGLIPPQVADELIDVLVYH